MGSWYLIKGKRYCQDCAPQAARQADVDLTVPQDAETNENSGRNAIRPAQPIPGLGRRSPGYLSPEKRVQTRLAESRIRLNVGRQPDGQPAWFVVNQGQVVLRPDGSDTGLAVTPAVRIGALKNGVQDVEEDTGQWMLTHIPSGRSLGQRAFERLETAHQLAGILAQLDWTRPAEAISDQEVQQVNQTFQYYHQALQAEQTRRSAAPAATTAEAQPADPPATTGGPAGLVGQLIADPYGGVARVLEDSRESRTVFVIDSLGQRYEINRAEAREPRENDFRLGRIAMPFDPAGEENGACSQCEQSTSMAAQDESWYRMDFKPFCPSCAGQYAEQEAYLMPDEINSELETM